MTIIHTVVVKHSQLEALRNSLYEALFVVGKVAITYTKNIAFHTIEHNLYKLFSASLHNCQRHGKLRVGTWTTPDAKTKATGRVACKAHTRGYMGEIRKNACQVFTSRGDDNVVP